jgi:uncharacterized protein (TIGR00369 family)
MVGLDTQNIRWTLGHIRQHIEQGLPLVPLFNIDVMEASEDWAVVSLREGDHVTRPGSSAGPVQFALADAATYALTLAARHDEAAVTVDLTINFPHPATSLPLVAVATPLRASCSPPRCGSATKRAAA